MSYTTKTNKFISEEEMKMISLKTLLAKNEGKTIMGNVVLVAQ